MFLLKNIVFFCSVKHDHKKKNLTHPVFELRSGNKQSDQSIVPLSGSGDGWFNSAGSREKGSQVFTFPSTSKSFSIWLNQYAVLSNIILNSLSYNQIGTYFLIEYSSV